MNRFLAPSLMNGTIGYLGDDSGSGSLSYKAALMQVLQKNTTFSYEMDYSAENSDFQTSGNLDPEHTQIQKEDSGMMHPEEYTEGEGELDMLIGYFIMNLICIVFFLMFGMCVICSCMRRRPKLFRAKNEEPEPNPRKNRLFSFKRASTPKMNFVAPPPITTPGLKPTFKAIVSKAIASDDFKKMVETSKKENSEGPGTQRRCSGAGLNPNEKARLLRRNSECHRGKRDVQIEMEGHEDAFRCKSVTNDVKIQIEPSDPSENNTTLQLPVPNGGLNQGQNKICPACHPETRTDPNHVCDCTCKNEEEIEEESSEDDSSEGQPSVPPTVNVFDIHAETTLSPSPTEAIGSVDWHRRIYLRNMFSKAVYYPDCEVVSKPMIEVVYYYPNKQVVLPCKVCHKFNAYNGLPKSWRVMRESISSNIENLKSNDPRWDTLYGYSLVHPLTTPNKMPTPKEKYASENHDYVPKTQYVQRDGNLIISHPHVDAYGLYYCRDAETWDILNHVYLLVPITPLYWIENWGIAPQECKDKTPNFFKMDEHHLFHFFPVILPPDQELCLNNINFRNSCNLANFNVERQPRLDEIIDLYLAEEADDIPRAKERTNLKVFVHWSEWSSCDGLQKMRTRSGYCHIGKRNREKIFVDEGDYYSGFPMAQLHRLLESVEEFKQNGIMLFSGVMANLLHEYPGPATHCTSYQRKKLNYFNNAIIKPILDVTKSTIKSFRGADGISENGPHFEMVHTLCFRAIFSQKDEFIKTIHGHKLIQNEIC